MQRWKWILAIGIVLLVLAGIATAMRLNIGASQVSRIDIGAAQESKDEQAIRDYWWWRRRHE